MRIAVTAKGAGLGARLDPHFGKCKQLLLVDEDDRFDAWPREVSSESGGQGILLAKRLIGAGCDALITGVIKQKAYEKLHKGGIDVYLAEAGSVIELVDLVRDGSLSPSTRKQAVSFFSARGAECR